MTYQYTIIYPFLFLIGLSFIGCSNNSNAGDTTRQTTVKEKAKEQSEKEDEEPEKLNEESAVEFLTKYGATHNQNLLEVETPKGKIKIRLYNNAPLHRANMLYLTQKGYFDDTWFYRVSKGHVIQAGNTDGTKTIKKRKKIGEYTVPAEVVATNYHKRGAVAMARSYYQNPEKNSDPFEFYIVLGKSYTKRELELLAEKHDMNFSEAQLNFYSNTKGSPHLDGQHTVIGEVVKGMDVVEAINNVEVDEGEWPLVNLPIKVSVVP